MQISMKSEEWKRWSDKKKERDSSHLTVHIPYREPKFPQSQEVRFLPRLIQSRNLLSALNKLCSNNYLKQSLFVKVLG